MRAQEQGRRGSKLREALRNLEAEKAKLRGAELAVEDLLKLKKPNLALLQARRDGIKYQHKMIAQFQAEADALAMAPRLETGPEGPGEGDNPSQIEPDSPATSRNRASMLETRRALLVDLASRPVVAVQDRGSVDTPEHLRPQPLDGRVAPPPFEDSPDFQATLAHLLRVLRGGNTQEVSLALDNMNPDVHTAPPSILRRHIADQVAHLKPGDLTLLQTQLEDREDKSILIAIKDAVYVALTADAPRPPRHRGPGGK